MTLRSAVVVAAVGVLGGFTAVSARGQVVNPETPQVLRPGPGIKNPEVIKQQEPKYTREAMREKIQGNVELEAVVRTDGTVGEITVIKSLDQTYGLDDAAVSAAKQWVFKPGTKDGKPVNVRVVLVLTFRLKTDGTPAPSAATQDSSTQRISAGNLASQMTDEEFTKGSYPDWTPDLVKPKAVRQAEPQYTSAAMRAKIQGDVLLEAVVGTDGTVIRARVLRPLDTRFGLDDEALKAVRQWTFVPGTLKGQAVPVLVRSTVTFKLR